MNDPCSLLSAAEWDIHPGTVGAAKGHTGRGGQIGRSNSSICCCFAAVVGGRACMRVKSDQLPREIAMTGDKSRRVEVKDEDHTIAAAGTGQLAHGGDRSAGRRRIA
jgi:hypothetical protein